MVSPQSSIHANYAVYRNIAPTPIEPSSRVLIKFCAGGILTNKALIKAHTMPEKIRYKNPPIVERIIGVYHQIPKARFANRPVTWFAFSSTRFVLSGMFAPHNGWRFDYF
jgi:hypothetical protein